MRYHPKEAPVERTCKQCNKLFMIWSSLLRHGKAGEHCSVECFLASRRVVVSCDHCSIEFSRQKGTCARYVNAKNFCSKDCMYKARRKNPDRVATKRLRYGSGEFQRARKQVIQRDGICQLCEDALANSVHHIDWNPYNNDLENLILLCKSCHGRFKHKESLEAYKNRIMACSDLVSDIERGTEMIPPVVFDSNNKCAAVP